jgi:RHS repeat-associated protein
VYVNAMILRDRDTNSDGTMDERLWGVQDANWNVVALVDGSQAVSERYTYDSYGTVKIYDGSYTVRSGGSSYASVVLFQGGRLDTVTGNTNFEHRDVDSATGTWTSTDPLGFAAHDDNLYRFVGNDPRDNVDSTGLQWRRPPLFPGLPRNGGPPLFPGLPRNGGGLKFPIERTGPGLRSRTRETRRGGEITVKFIFLKIGIFPPGFGVGVLGIDWRWPNGATGGLSLDFGIAPGKPGFGLGWSAGWGPVKPEKPEK